MRRVRPFNAWLFLVSIVVCLASAAVHAEMKAGQTAVKKKAPVVMKITESECTAKPTGTVIALGCFGVGECRWFENGEFHSECLEHLPAPK